MSRKKKAELTSRIEKLGTVKWKECEFIQSEGLKRFDPEAKEKLKNSLVKNNWAVPFYVWDDGETVWILDGYHRKEAMVELEQEGVKIPDEMNAVFIQCKNKREAAKLVMVYSSQYAKMTERGLKEFLDLNDLMLNELEQEIDFGYLDLSLLEETDLTNEPEESKEEKEPEEAQVVVMVGEYRVVVTPERYKNWQEDIREVAGFERSAIIKEIENRLKI